MFVCAGKIERFDFASPIGIGLVESAASVAIMCEAKKPDKIVFIGTAGSYGAVKIGEIVRATRSISIEPAFFSGRAYTPLPTVPIASEKCDVSRETTSIIINSPNFITTDMSVWKSFTIRHIHLENMEFYAVVKTSKRYGVDVEGVFGVTNYCNKAAHRDFIKHHEAMMAKLEAYIKQHYVI